jgi:4-hydroxyphenylpyruvate dioxygenase-like putative hemolysin
MIRNFVFLTVFVLLFFSCAPEQDLSDKEVPATIIQPDSMVSVLVDMQLAESVLREMRMTGKYNDSLAKVTFEKVFIRHNTNKEKFDESIDFYKQNLNTYEKIYENVITRLSQIQTEVTTPEIDDYE